MLGHLMSYVSSVRRSDALGGIADALSPISNDGRRSDPHPPRVPRARRIRRIAGLIAVLWTIALADLVLTIWAHLFTPFNELNPVAAAMLRGHLLPSLILFKVVLTMIGSTIFWRLRDRRRAEVALWLVVLIYVGLALRWSRYTEQVVADTSDHPHPAVAAVADASEM